MKFASSLTYFLMAFNLITDSPRQIENNSFGLGERFEYKIKLGFIPIGVANVNVSDSYFTVNNRPCYKVQVIGKTTGITDVLRIKNSYLSFIDTLAILPQKFVFSAREGNYRKDQTILFNHNEQKAIRFENNTKETFKTVQFIQDVVSNYYFLRTFNINKMKMGTVITQPMFFSDELYSLKVKFIKKTRIEIPDGKIDVFELSPQLPPNNLFSGEDAIKIWVSNDENKVPIKINVNFKIGSATIELKKYHNTKHPFNWIK